MEDNTILRNVTNKQTESLHIVAATGGRTLQSKRGKPKGIVRQRNKIKHITRRRAGSRNNALVCVLNKGVYFLAQYKNHMIS